MNEDDLEFSSTPLEGQLPAEIDQSERIDVEAFWNAYPLMFGQA